MNETRYTRSTAVSTIVATFAATAVGAVAGGRTTAAEPATPSSSPESAERRPHLDGDLVTLPLVLVKGYPFVEGEVNGRSGKFLFDTGDSSTFTVNATRVPASDGRVVGKGFFGSGQSFDVMRFPVIDELRLAGGYAFADATNVRGIPGTLLEGITPDFIGWIGVRFFDGYVMKLNYARPAASCYRIDASGTAPAALRGERVLDTLRLQNNAPPNLHVVPVRVGNRAFLAQFDSGSHSVVYVDAALENALIADGVLLRGVDGISMLTELQVGSQTAAPMRVDVVRGRPATAKLVGTGDEQSITLGYEFLSQYKTLWNFQERTLTLLAS